MTGETAAGVILAGGLSRRMGGGDKPLATLAGRPLLDHVLARLKPQAGPLALSANGQAGRFSGFGLPVLPDTIEGFAGPLAGILTGLEWLGMNTALSRLVTVAGDTPFFPDDLVLRLAKATADRPRAIAVASSEGRMHPTFALWPIDLTSSLRTTLEKDERRVTAFIEQHDHVEVEFGLREAAGIAYDPFFNINTPQDLAEAVKLAQAMT